MGPNLALCLLLLVKFYWNSAMSIYVNIVMDAVLGYNGRCQCCYGDHMAWEPKILTAWLFPE